MDDGRRRPSWRAWVALAAGAALAAVAVWTSASDGGRAGQATAWVLPMGASFTADDTSPHGGLTAAEATPPLPAAPQELGDAAAPAADTLELLGLLHAAAEAHAPAAGISFPDLRRCMLGTWPVWRRDNADGDGAAVSEATALGCVLARVRSHASRSGSCLDGLSFSPPMVRLLKEYTAQAMVRRGQPLRGGGGGRGSGKGGAPRNATKQAMHVLRVWNDNAMGGIGDHISGHTLAAAFALLSPAPRALVFDDLRGVVKGNIPLTAAWAPCPHGDGYNWTLPRAWEAELAPGAPLGDVRTGHVETDAVRRAKHTRVQHNSGWGGPHLVLFATNLADRSLKLRTFRRLLAAPAPLLTFMGNVIEGDWRVNVSSPPDAMAWTRTDGGGSAAAPSPAAPCGGLPPEFVGVLYGAPAGHACALATADEGGSRNATGLLHLSSAPLPYSDYSVLPASDYGAPSFNLFTQLFDFLFWPSPALVANVAAHVLQHYRPGRQYVVAVHLRIGTPAKGAGYHDPTRDSVDSAVPTAVRCAGLAMQRLVDAFGYRDEFLWYVASDRPDVIGRMRAAVAGGQAAHVVVRDGGNVTRSPAVRMVDLGLSRVVHTGKRGYAGKLRRGDLLRGTVDAYTEHFLLSAAHATVRSKSGFSSTAQIWGRSTVSLRLGSGRHHAGPRSCDDVSYYWGHR
jgi:hypothetical protein